MELEYGTIENVYLKGAGKSGGAIRIAETSGAANGKTILNNCTIQNCVADHGAAIHISSTKSYSGNTSTTCAIKLTNTTIQYCYARANNASNVKS